MDDDGSVYAIQYEEVFVFSSAGTLVAMWGGYGSGEGQFTGPSGIAVDGAGNVYVVEVGNSRVQQFAPGAPTPTPTPTTGPFKPLAIPGRIEAEDYNVGGRASRTMTRRRATPAASTGRTTSISRPSPASPRPASAGSGTASG